MRYADSRCQIHEEYKPEHTYVVSGTDIFSGRRVAVRIPAKELNAYRRGALIQDAMPSLNINEREFLLNGCYDDLSASDDIDEGMDE